MNSIRAVFLILHMYGFRNPTPYLIDYIEGRRYVYWNGHRFVYVFK